MVSFGLGSRFGKRRGDGNDDPDGISNKTKSPPMEQASMYATKPAPTTSTSTTFPPLPPSQTTTTTPQPTTSTTSTTIPILPPTKPTQTLFKLAIRKRYSAILTRLKTHPNDCAYRDRRGDTALHRLCRSLDHPPTRILRAIIAAHPLAACIQNKAGGTALLEAICRLDVVPALTATLSEEQALVLVEGCPRAVSISDNGGMCPFHCACDMGASVKVLRAMLLANSSVVHVPYRMYTTPGGGGGGGMMMMGMGGGGGMGMGMGMMGSSSSPSTPSGRPKMPLHVLWDSRKKTSQLNDISDTFAICDTNTTTTSAFPTSSSLIHPISFASFEDDNITRSLMDKMHVLLRAASHGSVRDPLPSGEIFRPLHSACKVRCPRRYFDRILHEESGRVLERDEEGRTPLGVAACGVLYGDVDDDEDDEDEDGGVDFAVDDDEDGDGRRRGVNNVGMSRRRRLRKKLLKRRRLRRKRKKKREGAGYNKMDSDDADEDLLDDDEEGLLGGFNAVHPYHDETYSRHIITSLLRLDSSAASMPDAEGRLPLHSALEAGFTWEEDAVKDLVAANPDSMAIQDVKTRLYPFMMASLSFSPSSSTTTTTTSATTTTKKTTPNQQNYDYDGIDQLTTAYELLVSCPELVSSDIINSGEKIVCNTHDRDNIKQVRREESLLKFGIYDMHTD